MISCPGRALFLLLFFLLSQMGSALATEPRLPRAGEVFWNQAGMKMVWIPSGNFRRGSPSDEAGRFKDEGPVFQVTLARGFWVSAYEVTQGEYQEITGKNPSRFQGDHRPVERVSWEEARIFCLDLTEREHHAGRLAVGWRYRLPSEAEWEYFARAGSTASSYGGPLRIQGECRAPGLDPLAWYCGNSGTGDPGDHDVLAWTAKPAPAEFAGTHRVGSRRPNYWGVFDVLGNVSEWCQDLYQENYWEVPRDGRAAGQVGERGDRVLRGGAWNSTASSTRLAHRAHLAEDLRVATCGLRPVLAPPAAPLPRALNEPTSGQTKSGT